jgi:DNA polymerase-3 subunit delta'
MSSVFDDLIDQEAVIATLKDAVGASKDSTNNTQGMTHSWLFTGPPGSGRSNAAISFAAALLCEKGGCSVCTNCLTVKDGSHADIELIRTEGLSIKVDEVRELITRTSWSPSVGNYRVVVIEDADRLTESAANALLKVIEEPGARTVWLLCAPTLTDVLPTIRSRCRHLTLRTPSVDAVTKLLIERDGIDLELAKFASSATQGHIGRARYLASNSDARSNREKILKLPSTVNNISSAFAAASKLMELAMPQTRPESEEKDKYELPKLNKTYGTEENRTTKSGNKSLRELEKKQKLGNSRLLKDNLDQYLIDIENDYKNALLKYYPNKENRNHHVSIQLEKSQILHLKCIDLIQQTRNNLTFNSSINLQLEKLFVSILSATKYFS